MSEKNNRKTLEGFITSDKADKTVTVTVTRQVQHPLFKKIIKRSTKVLAHDEKNECKEGDTVVIKEVAPISKRKRWMVVKVVKRGRQDAAAEIKDGSEN
ncbi:MAG: 30S ribosomal protein S17 [Candidatus Goldiibacteriota bacterium HGW-Goldbacteria-1]|jgi:small subunit ribosomal protein S17|nr:MAG: 30S ribosomal protein S17 [Candidatus Goldiibacteriota bacterium HGW-Goldbacteria-1]